jgi:type III pantothenate kinase
MILTVDVGNTNITVGLFDKNEMIQTFRMTTKSVKTSDEYGIFITSFLTNRGIVPKDDIEGVIVASVVPNIMHSLLGGIERYIYKEPIVVGPGLKTGIKINTENPREIGADRIVDAVAAYNKYGGPVLVIDFGTATTYDLVSAKGELVSGVTAPGIKISAKALTEYTAKLPEVEIKKPETILAQNTVSSMQAGLVFGQIGQTEYIVKKVKEAYGTDDIKVVATGGLGSVIANETDAIEVYNRTLTLDGLRLIYEKNRK